MKLVIYSITGTSSMLMHNPDAMTRGGEATLNKKKIPSAEEEAKASRYLTSDGYFRFPSQGFKSSLVSGGKGRRLGKQAATAILKGTVFPVEEWCAILDADTGKPMKGDRYEIDVRRAVIKQNGIQRSRAKVSGWACKVVFEIDDTIDEKIVEEVLNMAGRMVGVGDFRPEKGGPFGRFKAQLLTSSDSEDLRETVESAGKKK